MQASFNNEYDQLQVKVEDNGIGMSKEEMSRVFERFGKIKRLAEGGQEGIGLGLWASKKIVN